MTPDFKVGKDNKWFRQCVGIDIAKEKFNACLFMYDIASDMGCGTKSVEFKNTKHGFNQLVKWARKECLKEYPLTFIMEPTGVYYEPLAYHLCKIQQTVYIVMPNKARDFCNYEGIKTKTDEMDARCLALLGCVNRKLTPWQPPKPIFRELRQMTRFVEEIQKVRTMLSNHLEALTHGAEPVDSVVKHYKKLIADIDKQLQANLNNIKDKIATDKELEEKVERICTIKGIGYLTVVAIIAETNGFNLITSRKQLASFAGLDVIASQSGNDDPKHVISKKGNTHIRRALYWPGISASRFNPQMKDMYGRICKRNPKVKMIGITALMRKMLLLTFTLWKNGEAYDENKSGTCTPDKRTVDEDGRLHVQGCANKKGGCSHRLTATRDSLNAHGRQ